MKPAVSHQLTSFPDRGAIGHNHCLALNADGSRIAFARPWYGTTTSNLIYSVNYDGTGAYDVIRLTLGNYQCRLAPDG